MSRRHGYGYPSTHLFHGHRRRRPDHSRRPAPSHGPAAAEPADEGPGRRTGRSAPAAGAAQRHLDRRRRNPLPPGPADRHPHRLDAPGNRRFQERPARHLVHRDCIVIGQRHPPASPPPVPRRPSRNPLRNLRRQHLPRPGHAAQGPHRNRHRPHAL